MRFHKFAEQSFARSCTAAGAFSHPPDEDQNGWDFMVELPSLDKQRHADMQLADPNAFVQVKSTLGARRACQIKLTNALKAARSTDPWFIVLYLASKTERSSVTIFAKHFASDLIEHTFRETRKIEVGGACSDLNRYRISINFAREDEKTEASLVAWMKACIDERRPDYTRWKRSLQGSLGFENGLATGHLTFNEVDLDEIVDNLLGLGAGMEKVSVSLVPWRFGIKDKIPHFESSAARLFVSPTPAGICELRFRGQNGDKLSVVADVYVVGEPFLVGDKRRYRLSRRGIEIVCSMDGSRNSFSVSFNPHEVMPLEECEIVAALLHFHELGPIDLQMWTSGRRAMGAVLNDGATPRSTQPWGTFLSLIRFLNSLAGDIGKKELVVSPKELEQAAPKLHLMKQFTSPGSLKIECVMVAELPEDASMLIYFTWASIGDLIGCVVATRPIDDRRSLPDGRMAIYFGAPAILESWVTKCSQGDLDRPFADYRYHADALRSSGVIALELGDIGAVYEQGKQETPKT